MPAECPSCLAWCVLVLRLHYDKVLIGWFVGGLVG